MKTIKEVREAFWESVPQFQKYYRVKKRQNDYFTDIRCTFVDFVDNLARDNKISEKLAQRVTL